MPFHGDMRPAPCYSNRLSKRGGTWEETLPPSLPPAQTLLILGPLGTVQRSQEGMGVSALGRLTSMPQAPVL